MSDDLNTTLNTSEVLWKLSDLYSNENDPKLAADIAFIQTEAKKLHDQFVDRVHTLSASEICTVVKALEQIAVIKGRIATFAFLQFTTDTRNAAAGAFLQKIREIGSAISQHTVFFELEWNQVDENQAKTLQKDPVLSHYHHYLEGLRRYAPHLLSKPEENLLIEIAPVGRSSWTNLFDKIMGHLKFGPAQRSEEEVLSDLYSPQRSTRKKAAGELTEGLRSQLHILTHITNTLLADKMIDDSIRHYPSWVSSMNLYNEVSDATVSTLVQAVTERYDLPARYYRLKKELLGVDTLYDYDRYAPLPNLPEGNIPWEECKEIVLSTFTEFSPEFGTIGQHFFDNNWIHAPILEGKRGGAFAHPCTPDVHPYVMVNYTGNMRDIATVAHELGHGIHQYLAAQQGYINSDTPLVLAETASVFAELLVFKKQLGLIDNPIEKTAFIAQKIESIFATVFRQIAMNRFEHQTHNARRDQGELSSETLSSLWMETQQEMFGDSVILTDDYGIWWSYIPHFLNTPGYVYSYAFGELLVLALYQRFLQEGELFVTQYRDLLAAGGSKSPQELLKPFGIDLDTKEFWQGGLMLISEMMDLLEE